MKKDEKDRARGVIGRELVIHGRLRGACDLHVDGVLEGELTIEGALSIGADGTLVGPVEARTVEVAGELHGAVRASDSVLLRAGGLVAGDVSAPRVAIDDGAALHGAIEMGFDLGGGA